MTIKTFFTADTHFGSERTLALSKRPFLTVKEMDSTIVENWNSVVNKDDIVYHLGDFGNYKIADKLNGKIYLLYGNYEIEEGVITGSFKYYTSKPYMVIINDTPIWLAHKPSQCLKCQFNLFGHIHKLQMIKQFGLNVGVDCHNFFPIDTETVFFYKNAIENFYDSEVFI